MQEFTGLFYNDFRLMKVPQSSHHRLCAHEPRLLGPIFLSLVYILKNNRSVEYSPSFSWLMNLIIWRSESPTWMHREPQFLALNGNFCFHGYRFMPQIQPREARPLEWRIYHKEDGAVGCQSRSFGAMGSCWLTWDQLHARRSYWTSSGKWEYGKSTHRIVYLKW